MELTEGTVPWQTVPSTTQQPKTSWQQPPNTPNTRNKRLTFGYLHFRVFRVPSHVAAAICGHTEQIAKEHYWTVSVGDLDIAMDKLSPTLATKLAQMPVSEGLESSPNVSDSEDQETKKAPIIQGFDDICRLMSSLGISIGVDDIGLEPTTPTMSMQPSHDRRILQSTTMQQLTK